MFLGRIALSAFGGLLVYSGYQPLGWWKAAIVGVIVLVLSLSPYNGRAVSMRSGSVIAFAHSLVVYLLMLPWIGEFVGAFPYIALAIFLALYSLLLGAGGAVILAHRYGYIGFAFYYVTIEFLRSSWPYGGFAWVRLAWTQIDGPLASLAFLGGPALVSAMICLLATTLARWRMDLGHGLVLSLVVILSATAIMMPRGESTETVTVAAVQGNVPRLGLDFNAQRRAVLGNHVAETARISEPVDFAVWPENSSDVNPFEDGDARRLIDQAVSQLNAPILVGTITRDEAGAHNTMQVFDPISGPGEYHHKKFLQPFGEYMPMRDFFRTFSSMVDLAGNFQPGHGDGTVAIRAMQLGRNVRVGISTCYEVAFDQAGRDAVRAGAEILSTPTNNATFEFSDMTYQQLAMSRMRAIELDRAVIVAATSGVSAIVTPDGSIQSRTGIFEAKNLTASVPLKDSLSPAARFGSDIEWALVMMGLVAVALSIALVRRKL
ncbi:apolipoprotein N-acyltransferase [Corynebacterium sp. ES2715-CONJ3]|uniref:apolipoprotein N-acyltransferase n=1 Tax=Corynebacterium sp. ES2715-CONJ3 TaxID=2974028 RepID=UPI00216A3A6A|nr:apolipoprotein N-acyltransferase [Corynebacterium sp. ES2715-CONJ3]